MANRSALGISPKTDILGHISSLPMEEQPAAHAIIRAIESEAMLHQEPQPGLEELIGYLEKKRVRMGICTRNFEYVSTKIFSDWFSVSCLRLFVNVLLKVAFILIFLLLLNYSISIESTRMQ